MPRSSEKRRNVFSSRRSRKKSKKEFSTEVARDLAETDKGSYYNQKVEEEEREYGASAKKLELLFVDEDKQEMNVNFTNTTLEKPKQLVILDPEYLSNGLTTASVCKCCQNELELLEDVSFRKGFGTLLVLRCMNKDCEMHNTPSTFHTSKKSGQLYDVNRASVLGLRSIGRGASAAKKLFSIMNISKPISAKSWTSQTSSIEESAASILEEEMTQAAWESKTLRRNEGEIGQLTDEELRKEIVDIGVSLDCSWSSRGWSATDGVVAAIDVLIGKVVDVVHLSSSCTVCKKLEANQMEGKITRMDFLKQFLRHEPKCKFNHEGSAAAMEAAGVLTLYKRSIEKYGLRYSPYIGDGDSSGYSAVDKGKPYGPSFFVAKEECVSHITKRMGSNLRNLITQYKGKKLNDGKGLSGKGRLTQKRMNVIQNLYGQAIRNNKGDAKAMSKATHAILKHYSSTIENPRHDDCPAGPKSWCKFQRDKALGTQTYKPIINSFTPALVEVVQPVFDRLGSEELLSACEKCATQNTNESLHHVIWSMAPKEQYNSPQEISLAIALGVMQYNRGFQRTYDSVLSNVGVDVKKEMQQSWKEIDIDRVKLSNYRSRKEVKLHRKKKKSLKCAAQDAFVHQEGVQYKSSLFHVSETVEKGKKKDAKNGKGKEKRVQKKKCQGQGKGKKTAVQKSQGK